MLKKIPEKDLDSYIIFLARYLALFVGMPMMFGRRTKAKNWGDTTTDSRFSSNYGLN